MVFIRNYHRKSLISIMTDRILSTDSKTCLLACVACAWKQWAEERTDVRGRLACLALARPFFLRAYYFQAPATQATCLWKSSTAGIAISFHFNWILYFLSFFLQIPTVSTVLCADSSGRKDPYVLVYRLSWFFS